MQSTKLELAVNADDKVIEGWTPRR